MSMQHHPLSNAALGKYLYHETISDKQGISPAIFTTKFVYENGIVTLDNKWNYHTTLDEHCSTSNESESLTEGTVTKPSVPLNIESFTKPFGDKPTTIYTMQGVSPALDQQSIDGMDDMAFGSSSEADEDRIKNQIQNRAEDIYGLDRAANYFDSEATDGRGD